MPSAIGRAPTLFITPFPWVYDRSLARNFLTDNGEDTSGVATLCRALAQSTLTSLEYAKAPCHERVLSLCVLVLAVE